MRPAGIRAGVVQARRFMRAALGLDLPFGGLAQAIDRLGYVQIDPINVCGRMHDHILRNRVAGYTEGALSGHLYGGPVRPAVEHHHPQKNILVAFSLDAWPHLRGSMRARSRRPGAWLGRLTRREAELSLEILSSLGRAGPVSPEDFSDGRKGSRVWGTASLAKSTLQKLFSHGKVLIAARRDNRRLYDLPERLLPARVLSAPEPPADETSRWLVLLKMRQHRLSPLSRAERLLAADQVVPVEVPGCRELFCLREDIPLLAASAERAPPGPVRLLAPLDPLIYNRPLTLGLWDFAYTWEAYTPPARRVRGYYALPILSGGELVGHVDLKADREAGRLRVLSRRVRRGHPVGPAVQELASFLGLRA